MSNFEAKGDLSLAAVVLGDFDSLLILAANAFLLNHAVQQLIASEGLARNDTRFLADFRARQDAAKLSLKPAYTVCSFLAY